MGHSPLTCPAQGPFQETLREQKKRLQVESGSAISYFTADIATAQDYYPFGMLMPGRHYTFGSDSAYRYGFNGKENDNTIMGLGNWQDYGNRFYEPRIGRFGSMDPIAKQYPELTPYQFASDDPISNIDIDGLEGLKPGRNVNPDTWDMISEGDVTYPVRQAFNGLGNLYRKAAVDATGKSTYKRTDLVVWNNDDEIVTFPKITDVSTGRGWEGIKETASDLLDLSNVLGGEKNGAALFAKVPGKYSAIKEAIHHIFTNKNFKRGEKWSEKYLPIFEKAAYKLDAAINKVKVLGHKGPHPDAYQSAIYRRLTAAVRGLEEKNM